MSFDRYVVQGFGYYQLTRVMVLVFYELNGFKSWAQRWLRSVFGSYASIKLDLADLRRKTACHLLAPYVRWPVSSLLFHNQVETSWFDLSLSYVVKSQMVLFSGQRVLTIVRLYSFLTWSWILLLSASSALKLLLLILSLPMPIDQAYYFLR